MTQIIAFAGRKQSGKNLSCNFIVGHVLSSIGVVRGAFRVNESGQLWVSDLFGDDKHEGVFDVFRDNKAMKEFLREHVDAHIKLYSFADALKRDVCMAILGLTYKQCYGSDADKNSLTHLYWENMPGVITEPVEPEVMEQEVMEQSGDVIVGYYEKLNNVVYHEPGQMTAREVLQFVGTEVFRRMYGNCWVDAVIRRIKEDAPGIALICDCRFPNEVFGIQAAEGLVVRFTRNADVPETHESEVALDADRFDWDHFNLVIDNKDMSIADQCQATYSLMTSLGLVDQASEVS